MNCKALAVRKSGRTLKTLLTAIVVFASMITGMAQVPSYVPTNGLVGWWPFNGNANDESGNGNNGTVNGATLTADRNGNANAAYSFDPTNNSNILVPFSPSLNTIQNGITMSAWIYMDGGTGPSTPPRILELRGGYGNGGDAGFVMLAQNNSNVSRTLEVRWYNNNGTTNISIVPSPLITAVAWHHVVYACDGISGVGSLYVDGVFLSSNAGMSQQGNISSCNYNNNPLIIGSEPNSLGDWGGYLDDIAIWNRALTQQEITNLYTASTLPPCNPLAANLMNGLVGYWPFCGNANDESGNGNNGTVNGATLTSDRFGNVDAAYSFDRSSIKSIDIVNSNELDSITNISISLWMNISSYGQAGQAGYNHYLDKSDQNNSHQFILANNNVGLYFYYGSGSNFFQTNTLPILNQWNNLNLTYTYDGSLQNSWCRFYLNGICTDSFPTNVNLPITNYDLKIGSLGTANYNVVDGLLDDICIWNRALSQNEITQLYTGSPLSVINPDYQNTIKVYPNPSSTQITIDFGANYTTMAGYTMRIQNAVGQTVYTTGVTQQQFTSNLSTWTGNGIYFVYLIDAQGNTVDVKKIILQ